MLNDGLYIEKFIKDLGYFKTKKYRSLANEITYYYELYHHISLAEFITYVETKEYLYDDTMEIIKEAKISELNEENFKEFIESANNEARKIEIKELKEKINEELDENEKIKLANKLIEIKKGCVGNG